MVNQDLCDVLNEICVVNKEIIDPNSNRLRLLDIGIFAGSKGYNEIQRDFSEEYVYIPMKEPSQKGFELCSDDFISGYIQLKLGIIVSNSIVEKSGLARWEPYVPSSDVMYVY